MRLKLIIASVVLLFAPSCAFDGDIHKYVVRLNDWAVLEYYLYAGPEFIQNVDFYYTPNGIESGYLPLYTKMDSNGSDTNTQNKNRLFRIDRKDSLDLVLYNDSTILSPKFLFKQNKLVTEKGIDQVIKIPIDSIQYDSIYREMIPSKPSMLSYEKIKSFEWATRGILK